MVQTNMALQAELNEVKDSNLKLSKQLKAKLNTVTSGTTSSKTNSSATMQKTKNSKNTNDRKWQEQDEVWKRVAHKLGEAKTMKQVSKSWSWRIHHLAWCLHTSDNCRRARIKPSKHLHNNHPQPITKAALQVKKGHFSCTWLS